VEQARSMAHPWCRGRRRDAHVEAMDHLGGLEVAVEAEAAAVEVVEVAVAMAGPR
jgi:hypothetical protein